MRRRPSEKLQPQLAVESVSPRFAAGRGQPGYLAMAGAGGELLLFCGCVRPPGANQSTMARSDLDAVLDIVLRRERHEAAPEMMSRLRSRKAEVDQSIESRRAATRFEPDAATSVDRECDRSGGSEANDFATDPPRRRPSLRTNRKAKITHRDC